MQPYVSGKFIAVKPQRNNKLQSNIMLKFQDFAARLTSKLIRNDLNTDFTKSGEPRGVIDCRPKKLADQVRKRSLEPLNS